MAKLNADKYYINEFTDPYDSNISYQFKFTISDTVALPTTPVEVVLETKSINSIKYNYKRNPYAISTPKEVPQLEIEFDLNKLNADMRGFLTQPIIFENVSYNYSTWDTPQVITMPTILSNVVKLSIKDAAGTNTWKAVFMGVQDVAIDEDMDLNKPAFKTKWTDITKYAAETLILEGFLPLLRYKGEGFGKAFTKRYAYYDYIWGVSASQHYLFAGMSRFTDEGSGRFWMFEKSTIEDEMALLYNAILNSLTRETTISGSTISLPMAKMYRQLYTGTNERNTITYSPQDAYIVGHVVNPNATYDSLVEISIGGFQMIYETYKTLWDLFKALTDQAQATYFPKYSGIHPLRLTSNTLLGTNTNQIDLNMVRRKEVKSFIYPAELAKRVHCETKELTANDQDNVEFLLPSVPKDNGWQIAQLFSTNPIASWSKGQDKATNYYGNTFSQNQLGGTQFLDIYANCAYYAHIDNHRLNWLYKDHPYTAAKGYLSSQVQFIRYHHRPTYEYNDSATISSDSLSTTPLNTPDFSALGMSDTARHLVGYSRILQYEGMLRACEGLCRLWSGQDSDNVIRQHKFKVEIPLIKCFDRSNENYLAFEPLLNAKFDPDEFDPINNEFQFLRAPTLSYANYIVVSSEVDLTEMTVTLELLSQPNK